jgi:hypothetical protein
MTKPKATKPASPATDKSRNLQVQRVEGKTDDRAVTDMLAEGIATNATTAIRFIGYDHEGLSLTDMVASLKEQGQAVNRGDMSAGERMLMAQAVTLNAMFGELARRATLNMGQHLDAADRYLRLALKAQSQSRATMETLAAIKNPPVVFARQANINNGGQQQVNNGAAPAHAANPAHPGQTASGPNELLEDCTHGRTQLDTRATAAAGRASQSLEPVGAINRTANRRR